MTAVARDHWAGAAPVYGTRVRAALGIAGDDMEAILKSLQVDPAFPPEYAATRAELHDARHGIFHLDDCAALADVAPRGWFDVLDDGLQAVVAAVNPRARCAPAAATHGGRAWSIVIDEASAPLAESPWARAPRACSIAEFAFRSKPIA
jgi:hypothetical protein